jgi:hypothetical protein
MVRVVPETVEHGVAIGTALGWGMAMGGIQRVKPVVTTVLSFLGAIGGLIGAMTIKDPIAANMAVGVASSSAGIFGLGITAPVTLGASVGAKGPTKLLLKAGNAARLARIAAAGAGAGQVGEYIQEEQIIS